MGLKIKWRKTGVKQILGVQTYYHTTARPQVCEWRTELSGTADRFPKRTRTQKYGHSVSLRLGEGLVIIVAKQATKLQRDAHGLCL
jgi:hypothetical protein